MIIFPPIHEWKGGEPDRIKSEQFEFQFGKEGRERFEGFDSELTDGNFVFLHGYNVSGQQARGWQSEMFKRLFWAGSKAKFWGVSWYGSDSQKGSVTPNYHINVRNALRTAPVLYEHLNQTIIGPKDIAAHSLGNMVASSALFDFGTVSGLRNVFSIDAAVPLEAYTGDLVNGGAPGFTGQDDMYDPVTSPNVIYSEANPMIHPDWFGYAKKLGAGEWYQHFNGNKSIGGGDDKRQTLTFRNRFGNFTGTNYYNFYSEGEDVLDIHKGGLKVIEDLGAAALDGGRHSWALQEKLKGRMLFNVGGSTYGGWEFAGQYVIKTPTGTITYSNNTIPLSTANQLTSDQIKNQPFFKLGEASPLVGPGGEKMISKMFKENVLNMQSDFTNGWPQGRGKDKNWRHSDLKNVSYLYIYKIFEKIANPMGQTK